MGRIVKILDAISFSFAARGKFHLARVMPYAESFVKALNLKYALLVQNTPKSNY